MKVVSTNKPIELSTIPVTASLIFGLDNLVNILKLALSSCYLHEQVVDNVIILDGEKIAELFHYIMGGT